MNIGDLVFGFRGDGAPLEKDAKASGLKAGEIAGKEFDKSLSGRIKSMKADFAKGGGIPGALMGGAGIGIGLGAFGAITGGLGAVTEFLGDAGRAASDLAETESKLTAVFPTQANAIRDWAKNAATSMGMSTQAALEGVGTFGNFLQAMGQTEPVAADMSRTMVQLATDLGSFNNANPEDVLLALRSGLSGESEPLKQFGVDISDARVQTELLASGVKKVGGQFTTAQKIQGRYNLIMKQTVVAQGDFAKTATGTANATKSAAAQTENMKAKLGELVNNIQNVAAALAGTAALALTNALDAVGTSWNDLMRIIQPGLAFEQDVDKAIREQALALGLNADALLAFSDAQRQAAKEGAKAAELSKRQFEAAGIALGYLGDEQEAHRAEIEEYIKVHIEELDALEETTVAVDGLTDAQRSAKAMVEAFVAAGMPVPAAMKAIADGAEDIATDVKTIPPAAKVAADALEGFQATATVVMERVQNKKGKGWHWAEDISTRLHDLRTQFRNDIHSINYLLEHPGGANKTRNELVKELETLEKKRAKAAKLGNWEAFGLASQKILQTKADLAKLDGSKATITLDMNAYLANQKLAALGRSLGSITSRFPHRAAGGPVTRNMPYWVGENRRPELFVPETSGRIMTESQVGGSGRQDVYHHLSRETAANLRVEGFNDRAVAGFLRNMRGRGGLPVGVSG